VAFGLKVSGIVFLSIFDFLRSFQISKGAQSDAPLDQNLLSWVLIFIISFIAFGLSASLCFSRFIDFTYIFVNY
jgi:hypothetical protein